MGSGAVYTKALAERGDGEETKPLIRVFLPNFGQKLLQICYLGMAQTLAMHDFATKIYRLNMCSNLSKLIHE